MLGSRVNFFHVVSIFFRPGKLFSFFFFSVFIFHCSLSAYIALVKTQIVTATAHIGAATAHIEAVANHIEDEIANIEPVQHR